MEFATRWSEPFGSCWDPQKCKDIPADVLHNDELSFTKVFFSDKDVVQVVVDPEESFEDLVRENNERVTPVVWPAEEITNRN